MKRALLLCSLILVMLAPAFAQWNGRRLSGDDQRRFDSYFSRWQDYRRTNNQGEVRSMEGRMDVADTTAVDAITTGTGITIAIATGTARTVIGNATGAETGIATVTAIAATGHKINGFQGQIKGVSTATFSAG
jgi:hypothetical protein